MNIRTTGHHAFSGDAEASSSSGSCLSKFIQQFQEMGFPKESIAKAIEQNGDNFDLVLNALLTFKALEETPDEQPSASPQLESCLSSDDSSSGYYENFLDDVYEEDSWSSDSDDCKLSQKEQKLLSLRNMGYSEEDASIAIERCGPEALLGVLIDFISAAEWAREEDRIVNRLRLCPYVNRLCPLRLCPFRVVNRLAMYYVYWAKPVRVRLGLLDH